MRRALSLLCRLNLSHLCHRGQRNTASLYKEAVSLQIFASDSMGAFVSPGFRLMGMVAAARPSSPPSSATKSLATSFNILKVETSKLLKSNPYSDPTSTKTGCFFGKTLSKNMISFKYSRTVHPANSSLQRTPSGAVEQQRYVVERDG